MNIATMVIRVVDLNVAKPVALPPLGDAPTEAEITLITAVGRTLCRSWE